MKRLYPLRKNGRFYNPDGNNNSKGFLLSTCVLLWEHIKIKYFSSAYKEASSWLINNTSFQERCSEPTITWLGHATFLIQINGVNILTDPIFGNLSYLFPRMLPHVTQVEKLPPIDYVLISHNHPDHTDLYTLRQIKQFHPDVQFLVPYGDKAWFDKKGLDGAQEFFWWESCKVGDSCAFTFLPSVHWSQRGLFDKNKSLWGSWMIQDLDTKIYFAGDTGWGQHFKQIGQLYKYIDIALLPIGPGEPKGWMQHAHINAEEAGEALLDLKAKHFIPMHWGTYHLGVDSFKEPIDRLTLWWKKNKKRCVDKALHIIKAGQNITYKTQARVFKAIRKKMGILHW